MTEASIIYGLHAVRRAIESGQAGHLYVRSGKRSPRIDEVLALCAADQALEWVDESRLSALTGTDRHQGMVFESVERQVPTASLDALMMAKEGRRLLLALDGVTDPGNLGACLRSAATFGVDGVIVPKHGSAPV
ncbi:MAG: RNA methyltransferase substrate-binding domain-containing protein, partial [Pseudomonadota bacterium]|nr:RNA methyltransferase substrate-binding domain-containing protein [Pseudomonadota bacterium]